VSVLPTRVGMVPVWLGGGRRWGGSPHARGDGPPASGRQLLAYRFSPRAWGWSFFVVIVPASIVVLPTRVGMVRNARNIGGDTPRSPHARGDGPEPPPEPNR